MPTWTQNEIALVGAQGARFPNLNVLHWQALRNCVEAVRDLLRETNAQMSVIETDQDLNPTGITRKRADVAKSVISKLDDFTKLQLAEHEVEKRFETLRGKVQTLLAQGEPKTAAEATLTSEIRAYIAKQQSPAMAAIQHKNDPRVVAAVLNAPAFLSGLTDEEVGQFRSAALDSTDLAQEERQVSNALDVCRAAIKAAQQMIARRADLRRDPDGGWRYIKEAMPRVSLAA